MVADDRVAVGTDRNRRVQADHAGRFERLVGAGGAGRISAHVQLQITVDGAVEVADDRVAVGPDRNLRVEADVTRGYEFPVNAGCAGRIRAHIQLQITVDGVAVADDRVAVGPDRNL